MFVSLLNTNFHITFAGQILSMCGGVTFDSRAAYIGFYATAPELHGLGIGIKTWRAVMDHIGTDSNIGLCAAPSQIKLYRDKGGFVHPDQTTMICTECDTLDLNVLNSVTPADIEINEFNDELLDEIVKFDENIVGYNRHQLISLGLKEEKTLALVATNTSTNKVVGYGCLKWSNVNKAMLGPLYADTATTAETLLLRLLSDYKHENVSSSGLVWLLLDGNKTAVELCKRLDLKFSDKHSPRLYTKYVPQPPVDVSKVYAIFSPDIAPY